MLFAHNGAGPNGDWKLYVQDDFLGDIGTVATGWALTLTPRPRPSVSIDDAAAVGEGGDAVFTVTLSSPPVFPVDVDFGPLGHRHERRRLHVDPRVPSTFGPLETSKTICVATL